MTAEINKRQRTLKFSRLFFGIAWDFWREARLSRKVGFKEAEKRMSGRHKRRAIEFRKTAVEMGGVLIKLGQFIGSRVDVVPEAYIVELMKLQDEVPPEDFPSIKTLVEEEFGRPLDQIFASFNPQPRAAASLGQVHEAVLKDGEKVAVKVQRPGIEKLIDIDMGTFKYLMDGMNRFTRVGERIDLIGLVDEFARVLNEELDFYHEAYNAEEFKKDFAGNPSVYVPGVMWEYTTDRVITLEYVDGIKINDYEALEKAGIDRHELATTVVDVYVTQLLENGFFHADPHPGNLFVKPGPQVTFVDFGMVGYIDAKARDRFIDILLAMARRDADETIEGAIDLGFIRRGASLSPIRNAINWMFERYTGVATSKEITLESLDDIQEDIRMIMRESPFKLPVEFAYLGKTFAGLIGLIAGLDPDFDIVDEARPYIEKLKSEMQFDVLFKEAQKFLTMLVKMPAHLERVLTKAENGELKIKDPASDELVRLLREQNRARRSSSINVFASALAIGAVILYINYFQGMALILFLAAAALFIFSLFGRRQRSRLHPF